MEATLVYTPVQCPNVLAMQQFTLALAGSVNRSVVREAVQQAPRFPLVSLRDMDNILRAWQFETVAFRVPPTALAGLPPTLLAHCTWSDGDQYFVVIRKVETGLVHYFSPFQGDVVQSIDAFVCHWSGALLAATPGQTLADDLTRSDDEETVAAQRYHRDQIRLYEQFFSADECAYLIGYAEERNLFKPSQIEYTGDQGVLSLTRTSYSASLRERTDPVFREIYQRVAATLRVAEEQIENLQCVRYGEGQQFKPHFDSGPSNHRLHTLLVYLNDGFDGGETFFPELNLTIQPQAGRALYFLNRDPDNAVLLQSAHAGLPVRRGVKYACNVWVRNRPVATRTAS